MVGLHAQWVNGVTVCTVGRELWRGALSDRILIAENRCAAFFVSTVSGTQPLRRMSAARRIVERSHPDCRKLVRCSFRFNPVPRRLQNSGNRQKLPIHAPSSVQNIRLSADAANPLSRSRNWRADSDGSSVCSRRGSRVRRFARLAASPGEDR